MAKKKNKRKKKKPSFGLLKSSGKKRKTRSRKTNWLAIITILIFISLLSAAAAGFILLDRYNKTVTGFFQKPLKIKITNPPSWITRRLEEKIFAAAGSSEGNITLTETAARNAYQSIQQNISWLKSLRIQTTGEQLLLTGTWRKPLAMFKRGLTKYYLDREMTVMDYLPMPQLPVINITGVDIYHRPVPGEITPREDLTAAVKLIDHLDKMDQLVTPEAPLLSELNRIDMSNYNGRLDSRQPHIIIYAADNTQIIWGAELGKWQQNLESTDKEKLAKLYSHYEEFGTLLNGVKYINLRDPQDEISQPIDKY